MEESGLPERLFKTGFEPSGRKRINNYFNLRWIEVINQCISTEQREILAESQFRQILKMGQHTFSVMFVHQLLCRQLVTRKKYELWWTFAGKPIRYGIGEYALVTGLNCSKANTCLGHPKKKGKYVSGTDGAVWKRLFGREDKITPEWIIARLAMGDKYKDSDTRLRLSLLLLVEGILCPTSGATTVRPEVVELVGDIDAFLKYPWGRESFVLTVRSAKARTPAQYANDTTAIQGFSHAIVLVTVCCCPQIVAEPGLGDKELTVEGIVENVCGTSLKINVVTTRNLELIGQASVRSILCVDHDKEGFDDEAEDVSVSHMVSLIKEDFPFEINSWLGGVKANEAKKLKSECLDGQERHGGSTFTPVPGGGSTMVVESLLRLATDAFEERVVSMFAGYTLSVKHHFDQAISSLKESVADELAKLNGTRQEVSPNGSCARRDLCVPPTVSGERSQETRVNSVISLDAKPEEQSHEAPNTSHLLNEDSLRDIEDSTYFSPNEVSTQLPMIKHPGRFVLNAVDDALISAHQRDELSLSEPIVKTVVPLLEELARVVIISTDPGLESDATRVALRWFKMMGVSSVEKSQLEVWAFLQFIVAFGLVKQFKLDETLELATCVAHFKQAPKLFQSLGLSDTIPNFVTELLNKAMFIPAIRFMFYFNVKNNFSPLEFLKEEIINLRRSAKEKRRDESQAEANRDSAALRDIMELIEDLQLEIDIPVDLILKFMVPRDIQIQNQRVVSSSVPASDTVFQSSCIATHGSNLSLPTSFGTEPSQAGGSTALLQGQQHSHHAGSKRPRVDNGDPRLGD